MYANYQGPADKCFSTLQRFPRPRPRPQLVRAIRVGVWSLCGRVGGAAGPAPPTRLDVEVLGEQRLEANEARVCEAGVKGRARQGGGGRQGRRGSHEARVAAAGVLGDKKSTPLIKVVAGWRAVFLLMRGRGVDGRSTACNYERASRPMYLPERAHLAHQEPHIVLSAVLVRVGQETGGDVPTVAIRVSSRASLK